MCTNLEYTYPFLRDEFQTALSETHYIDRRSLGYREVKEGVVLPYYMDAEGRELGGVIDNAGEFIPNTGFHVGKEGYYEYLDSDIDCIPYKMLYLGIFNPVWGHCITDNLKHLWFFLRMNLPTFVINR